VENDLAAILSVREVKPGRVDLKIRVVHALGMKKKIKTNDTGKI